MTSRQSRAFFLVAALAALGAALALVLLALEDSVVFFYSPADITDRAPPPGQRLRLGGLVLEDSIRQGDGLAVTFTVTDRKKTMQVDYDGPLPDLFREGQGVVAEGVLRPDGSLLADTILARHDETYMPADVADALKRQGVWQGEGVWQGSGSDP